MSYRNTAMLLLACAKGLCLAHNADQVPVTLAQSKDPGLGTNPNAQGATSEVTPGSGPNGSEDFMNGGLNSDGWTAPFLSWDSLVKIDRSTFYGNVGSACKQYDWAFQQSGDRHGIDPVFLAFIAMQESSCNADAGGPTPGLMQVACSNYPDGQCTKDVAKNVDAGAAYLKSQLDESGRNAIKTIGRYNGWFTSGDGATDGNGNPINSGRGLTLGYPCSSEGIQNGQPQNLDYLQQTLNGWFVGLNPQGDDSWIGQYRCQGNCNNGQLC